jgi:hypothetical protein
MPHNRAERLRMKPLDVGAFAARAYYGARCGRGSKKIPQSGKLDNVLSGQDGSH